MTRAMQPMGLSGAAQRTPMAVSPLGAGGAAPPRSTPPASQVPTPRAVQPASVQRPRGEGGGPEPPAPVSDRAAQIAGRDSPLMERAALAGEQQAARRGLLSSSLAAGAAQGAVLDRASQLAQADVQAAQQRRSHGLERDRLALERELGIRGAQTDEDRLQLQRELGVRGAETDEGRLAMERELGARGAAVEERRVALQRELGLREQDLAELTQEQQHELARRDQWLKEKGVDADIRQADARIALERGKLNIERDRLELQERQAATEEDRIRAAARKAQVDAYISLHNTAWQTYQQVKQSLLENERLGSSDRNARLRQAYEEYKVAQGRGDADPEQQRFLEAVMSETTVRTAKRSDTEAPSCGCCARCAGCTPARSVAGASRSRP